MKREILFNKAPIFIQKTFSHFLRGFSFSLYFFVFDRVFRALVLAAVGFALQKYKSGGKKRERPVRFDKQHDKLNSVV